MIQIEKIHLVDQMAEYITASKHWNPKQRNFRLEPNPTSDFMYWIMQEQADFDKKPYQQLSDTVELNLAQRGLREGQIFEYAKKYFGRQMHLNKRRFYGSPFDEFFIAVLMEKRPRKSPRKYRHRDYLISELIQKLTVDGVQVFQSVASEPKLTQPNACQLVHAAFQQVRLPDVQMLTTEGINQIWKTYGVKLSVLKSK
jgi:hypothetical protein